MWDNDTRLTFEERAAIMEYCGGLPRAEAERRAREIIDGPPPSPQQSEQMGLDLGRQFFNDVQRMFG